MIVPLDGQLVGDIGIIGPNTSLANQAWVDDRLGRERHVRALEESRFEVAAGGALEVSNQDFIGACGRKRCIADDRETPAESWIVHDTLWRTDRRC